LYPIVIAVPENKIPVYIAPDPQMAKSLHSNKRDTVKRLKDVSPGSPLNPLLSNLMLNELDIEL